MRSAATSRAPGRFLRLFAYLLFLALVLEGMARLAVGSEAIFARIASPYDEPSWRLRWLRQRGGDLAPTRLSFDRHHAERGWTLAPDLRDLPVFAGKRLSSNSRGLRGEREFATPKPAGVYRIAFFGDSFTFGEDVSDDETFAHHVERLLAADLPEGRLEVLNFGIHGYGHDQMLLYLRETLPLYQPDVVVLGYVSDDSLRNLTRFRDFAKPRFRLNGGRLVLEGVPVPTPEQLIARERWRPRLFDLLTMAKERIAWRWGGRAAEVDRLTDALLSEIVHETRAAGARPAIALLPAFGELRAQESAPLPAEAFVLEVAAREQVPCLRLRPLFLERARLGAELPATGHWNAREHRWAAGGIADFFRREKLTPRPSSP